MTQHAILTENDKIQLPTHLCQQLHLTIGQQFICLIKGQNIHLIPQKNIKEMRGLLKGANINNIRDRDDL